MVKIQIVKRKLLDLKPDPDQPRKKFDDEVINNLAQTMKSQGIINTIEIDENDIIITGELRWRAAKIAFKNGELFDCKLLSDLKPTERYLRQCVENFQHNRLTEEEEIIAIQKIHKIFPDWTQEKIASEIGRSNSFISISLRWDKIEKAIGRDFSKKMGKQKSLIIDSALTNPIDKQKLARKTVEENLKREEISELVKEIKTMPKEIKEKMLEPHSKITLNDAKEIAQMPNDVRKEILKPKSELTIKEAKEVSEFPKPEQRKAIMKQVKQTKEASKKLIQQKKDIVEGKRGIPTKVINLDTRFVNAWKNTRLVDVPIKIRKKFLESYSEETRQECLKLVKSIMNYLIKEFSEDVKVIDTR